MLVLPEKNSPHTIGMYQLELWGTVHARLTRKNELSFQILTLRAITHHSEDTFRAPMENKLFTYLP